MSISAATRVLTEAIRRNDHITILTGAGISAESGIPTFRGPEGFWTIGSREFYPQEMATLAMFSRAPESVWEWYLYRNERHYRFNTALETAGKTRLLITVGTAGATTLPNHIVRLVHEGGGLLIDINVADNPFADLASRSDQGIFINHPSSKALVALTGAIAQI